MLTPTITYLVLAQIAAPVSEVPFDPSDPGPSPECPADMRLVSATHFDEVQHLCIDPQKDTRDTHCFSYFEGVTAFEGKTTDIRVCVDEFEAPNKKGAAPLVMKSYRSAKRYCEARHKRMCTEQEWETACEGPEARPLAYGWAVDKTRCNSNKQWKSVDWDKFGPDEDVANAEAKRLWQGTPSGRFPNCISSFGVKDMMGNVEEWVTSRASRKFPGALMGGFWAKPWTGCRGTNDAHEPTFVFYETGFRCCADPGTLDQDGKRIKKDAKSEENGVGKVGGPSSRKKKARPVIPVPASPQN